MNKKWKSFLIENLFNFDALKPKENLHLSFWQEKRLNREILNHLLDLAEDIVNSMEIEAEIKDITLTGSLASYNWHDLSDIDLHIIFDFDQIDENRSLVKRMLDQSRINWNKTHDIRIENHEVELYFQDINEPHEALGVYSLLTGAWLREPSLINIDLDLRNTEKKAAALQGSIDHIYDLFSEGDHKAAYEYASKIKKKISKMRQSGLKGDGVYSIENLAFKMLRNSGDLEKLSSLKIHAYDKMMSLDLSESKLENRLWNKLIKKG